MPIGRNLNPISVQSWTYLSELEDKDGFLMRIVLKSLLNLDLLFLKSPFLVRPSILATNQELKFMNCFRDFPRLKCL